MLRGDYKPLGALLAWGALVVAFGLCWALASLLIFGSRHKGSWGDLHTELEAMRKEQADQKDTIAAVGAIRSALRPNG